MNKKNEFAEIWSEVSIKDEQEVSVSMLRVRLVNINKT